MVTKYIHIGYPKNFSTSLQRDYFSKHPQLFHLGIGIDNNLGYTDSTVEKTLEVYLKTCKSYKYEEVKDSIKSHFAALIQQISLPHKAIGVSAEHLSFAFTYDSLSNEEKAQRLYKIFGKHTKIIMIVRNQFDLIKSMYKECVRVGFANDFSTFLYYLYKYQDRNFVYDFRYDLCYRTYSNLFGKANVGVYFFEDYRDNKGNLLTEDGQFKLFADLNGFLGVDNLAMHFGHYNEAIPNNKIPIKAVLNRDSPHDLTNHLFEIAEKHRIKKYVEEDLNLFEENEETYRDVLTKRKLISETMKSDETELINFQSSNEIESFFKAFYEAGNKRFSKELERQIPTDYSNLKF